MITVENLEFHYGQDVGKDDFRLSIDQLHITSGERLAIVGPSGSGKTTLLNLMAGILIPERGSVQILGQRLNKLPDSARRDFRLSNIGLVFQSFELLEYLSVFDNILLPIRISRAHEVTLLLKERAATLARDMGIGDKLNCHISQLSQGERQRVAVCRALLLQPKLLLADEPTGNLDPNNKHKVISLLLDYAIQAQATLVTVTHDVTLLDSFSRVIDVNDIQSCSSTCRGVQV